MLYKYWVSQSAVVVAACTLYHLQDELESHKSDIGSKVWGPIGRRRWFVRCPLVRKGIEKDI
jgi:hypothetical protein